MANSNNVRSELDERIIRQVEYYFGDYNLPRDKFLQEQIKLDDGWIPLSTMLNFKRLAALTTDQDRIIEAIKKSTKKLIEIDEEQKKIRRSLDKPVPVMSENRQKEIQSRTVYCKGFSKENASLDKLLEYFSQYGSIENVQMRTYLDKATKEYIFKGSVFVVFSAKDQVDEFLKKEKVEYEGVSLIVKRQEDYFIDKKKERDDKKRLQRAKLQQVTGKQPAVKKEKDDEENKDSDEEEEKTVRGFVKGAVVHIKDVPSDATWEDIKSAVEAVWKAGAKEGEDEEVDVAYVDFHIGDEEGWIRLAEAGAAAVLLRRARHAAALGEKMEVDEKKADEKKPDEKKPDEKKVEEKVDEKKVEVDEKKVKEKVDEKKVEGGEVDENKMEKKVDGEKVEEKKVEVSEDGEVSEAAGGAAGKDVNGDDGVTAKKDGCETGQGRDSVQAKVKEEQKSEEDDGESDKGQGEDTGVGSVKEEAMSEEGKEEESGGVKMEVCGVLVEMRILRGSEEEAYLEKAHGARERRFMSGGKGRSRGGGRRGGGRKGRGNRGGKRKSNWDSGPSNKRVR